MTSFLNSWRLRFSVYLTAIRGVRLLSGTFRPAIDAELGASSDRISRSRSISMRRSIRSSVRSSARMIGSAVAQLTSRATRSPAAGAAERVVSMTMSAGDAGSVLPLCLTKTEPACHLSNVLRSVWMGSPPLGAATSMSSTSLPPTSTVCASQMGPSRPRYGRSQSSSWAGSRRGVPTSWPGSAPTIKNAWPPRNRAASFGERFANPRMWREALNLPSALSSSTSSFHSTHSASSDECAWSTASTSATRSLGRLIAKLVSRLIATDRGYRGRRTVSAVCPQAYFSDDFGRKFGEDRPEAGVRDRLSFSDVPRLNGRKPGLPGDPCDRNPSEPGEDLSSEDRRVRLPLRVRSFPLGSLPSAPGLNGSELGPSFRGPCVGAVSWGGPFSNSGQGTMTCLGQGLWAKYLHPRRRTPPL